MSSRSSSVSEEEAHEHIPAPRIGNIKGVKIRRRVNPAESTERKTYRIVRKNKRSVRGLRVYFTIFDDKVPLYSTKMKGRHPSGPLPIAKGSEMHYRMTDFAGYLLNGNKHSQFSLRAKDPYGNELMSTQFHLHDGRKDAPRDITANFFAADSIVPQKIVNKRPEFNPDGYWELDFGNRRLITSVRNTIFIREEDEVEFVVVRKVSKNEIEVDAVEVMSPLCVFAIVLSLFESSV